MVTMVTMCNGKAVIKTADSSEDATGSVECAIQVLELDNIEKHTVVHIEEFDRKYNHSWYCFVRWNFGSYTTHKTKHFIYFYLGQVAILLFKSG